MDLVKHEVELPAIKSEPIERLAIVKKEIATGPPAVIKTRLLHNSDHKEVIELLSDSDSDDDIEIIENGPGRDGAVRDESFQLKLVPKSEIKGEPGLQARIHTSYFVNEADQTTYSCQKFRPSHKQASPTSPSLPAFPTSNGTIRSNH